MICLNKIKNKFPYIMVFLFLVIVNISSCRTTDVVITNKTFPINSVDKIKVINTTSEEPLTVKMKKSDGCQNYSEIGEINVREVWKIGTSRQDMMDMAKQETANLRGDILVITKSDKFKLKGIAVKCVE